MWGETKITNHISVLYATGRNSAEFSRGHESLIYVVFSVDSGIARQPSTVLSAGFMTRKRKSGF